VRKTSRNPYRVKSHCGPILTSLIFELPGKYYYLLPNDNIYTVQLTQVTVGKTDLTAGSGGYTLHVFQYEKTNRRTAFLLAAMQRNKL